MLEGQMQGAAMKIGTWAKVLLLAAPVLTGCSGFWDAPASSSSGGCKTNCSTASSGNFYILNNGTTPQILGYSFASGVLTAMSGSPFTVTGTPYAIAIAPSGNFLYVSSTDGIVLYPISNGALGTATV